MLLFSLGRRDTGLLKVEVTFSRSSSPQGHQQDLSSLPLKKKKKIQLSFLYQILLGKRFLNHSIRLIIGFLLLVVGDLGV